MPTTLRPSATRLAKASTISAAVEPLPRPSTILSSTSATAHSAALRFSGTSDGSPFFTPCPSSRRASLLAEPLFDRAQDRGANLRRRQRDIDDDRMLVRRRLL